MDFFFACNFRGKFKTNVREYLKLISLIRWSKLGDSQDLGKILKFLVSLEAYLSLVPILLMHCYCCCFGGLRWLGFVLVLFFRFPAEGSTVVFVGDFRTPVGSGDLLRRRVWFDVVTGRNWSDSGEVLVDPDCEVPGLIDKVESQFRNLSSNVNPKLVHIYDVQCWKLTY